MKAKSFRKRSPSSGQEPEAGGKINTLCAPRAWAALQVGREKQMKTDE